MIKKYFSLSLVNTILLTFITYFSFGQSNHTVTFTGNTSDFNAAEKSYGGDDVDYYVTFDDTYMYFAAFRVNGSTFGDYDHFTVYLDTDPQPGLTSGNGSTTGLNWDSQTPTMPYNADHRFAIRNNALGESFHHKYTGASWDDQTGASSSSFNQFATSTALEIRIPIANIDNAKGVYFSMYMSYNGGFFGANDVNYPITFSGSTFSGYFGGIGLTSAGCNPIDHKNQPIQDELINTNPIANTKYAFIDINDNDYSVTGDIDLVSGGSGTVAAGKSLTVNGSFNNDGYFELQSISNSYSSLIATTSIGNITYKRHVNDAAGSGTSTTANDLISPPVSGMTFGDLRLDANTNILSGQIGGTGPTFYLFGPFDNSSTNNYVLFEDTVDDGIILDSGVGYRTGSTDGETYTFTGTAETGNVMETITTPSGGSQWNLIGNPYPSYITLDEFLSINNSKFDINAAGVYGYDGAASDGWEVWNSLYSAIHPNAVITPGQGFFVASASTSEVVNFNSDMRSSGNTDDFIPLRSTSVITNVKLNMSTTNKNFNTDIYFTEFSTLGLDPGFDASLFGGTIPEFSVYSNLVEENNNVPFGIQAVGETDYNDVTIPLGVSANQGEQLTFNISETTIPSTVEVYLDDTIENTSTLLNSGDYILTPTTNLSGTGRFFLRFIDNSLNIQENNFDDLEVFASKDTKEIIINGQLSQKAIIEVFDIQGRLIMTSNLNSTQSQNRIDVSNVNTGIYIIKLQSNNTEKTQKLVIE
ncbi:T9SS type A sorting domain-containing protein [Psychroserpens luteus]|uniref:T9SS type A sorting domain-containing protein n=1 Tax=Psychroserpens luteus TaxID=1434066 RepID=A0ABW5ZWR1_9FLAO|nr:T9SS type A sorting domain-containing protein [Psychroserpens luteus]